MDMLTLSHVKKRFGEKQVLKDVSFSVPEHKVFGFVGENGAGKTTAMKLILGLLKADGGHITVNGIPVRYGNGETNSFIGYLPDVPEFYPYMTAEEYLRFCGAITGMSSAESKARSRELLKAVGLSGGNKRIKGFSRGMKQRLGIAQALFNRPKLLICDEPTSALDPAGRRELLDILVSVKVQTTVLFSTHILSDVEKICDELALLHDGRIVLQGSLDDIQRLHGCAAVELETEKAEDGMILMSAFPSLKAAGKNRFVLGDVGRLSDILGFIAERKLTMRRIERLEPTLEDLFLEVIGK